MMTQDGVIAFLKSWGLFPSAEDPVSDGLTAAECEALVHGLNIRCYNQMLRQGNTLYGHLFAAMLRDLTEHIDGAYHLAYTTWAQLRNDLKFTHNLS